MQSALVNIKERSSSDDLVPLRASTFRRYIAKKNKQNTKDPNIM